MTETREKYQVDQPWKMAPMLGPPRRDPVDILFSDLQTGAIDMAAAAQRVRELIGAAEVASANEARESWVRNEITGPLDRDYEFDNRGRCYCGARDGQCSH